MMASKSNIEWTGHTWNPLAGCSVLTPGCKRCYAMKMAARLDAMGQELYKGLTEPSKAGPVWTGVMRRAPEHVLLAPLKRKKPTVYFVNSMSDLFHENVPDEWIDRVFAVMALAPQHTFQCLTKRAARMRKYCSDPDVTHRVAKAIDAIHVDRDHDPVERWAPVVGWSDYEASTHGNVRRDDTILKQVPNPITSRPTVTLWQANEPKTFFVHTLVLLAHKGPAPEGTEARHRNGNSQDNRLANLEWASGSINQADKVRHGSNGGPAKLNREQAAQIRSLRAAGQTQQSIADQFGVSRSLISMIESRSVWPDALAWPLPNCWLGVSTERQQEANERIPLLLQTPAAVRFISAEPLLGPIDLRQWSHSYGCGCGWGGDSPLDYCNNCGWKGDAPIIDTHEGDHVGDCLQCREPLSDYNACPECDGHDGDGMSFGPNHLPKLDWVIVGGESGSGYRDMDPIWAKNLRLQCEDAGVAFFLKQMAGKKPIPEYLARREFPRAAA